MIRMILAAAATLALVFASPAFACPDCKDCPHHKDTVASADKVEKKDAKKCKCGATSAKDCKCGDKCDCHAKKGEKDKKDSSKT